MSTRLQITVDELKKRMESGEDFTIIDVRNPVAWAESDTMIPEILDQDLGRIPKSRPVVAYCT
jgi:rhodanese-related sulfurtransferase